MLAQSPDRHRPDIPPASAVRVPPHRRGRHRRHRRYRCRALRLRGGEEKDVFTIFGGVKERRFPTGGPRGDQVDTALGSGTVGGGGFDAGVVLGGSFSTLRRLVLVDILGAVGVRGDESIGRIKEQPPGIAEDTREVPVAAPDRTRNIGGDPGFVFGCPGFVVFGDTVPEERGFFGSGDPSGSSEFPAVGASATGVTGRADERALAAPRAGVIEKDLLVRLGRDSIAIVIAGKGTIGHESKPATVRRDTDGVGDKRRDEAVQIAEAVGMGEGGQVDGGAFVTQVEVGLARLSLFVMLVFFSAGEHGGGSEIEIGAIRGGTEDTALHGGAFPARLRSEVGKGAGQFATGFFDPAFIEFRLSRFRTGARGEAIGVSEERTGARSVGELEFAFAAFAFVGGETGRFGSVELERAGSPGFVTGTRGTLGGSGVGAQVELIGEGAAGMALRSQKIREPSADTAPRVAPEPEPFLGSTRPSKSSTLPLVGLPSGSTLTWATGAPGDHSYRPPWSSGFSVRGKPSPDASTTWPRSGVAAR